MLLTGLHQRRAEFFQEKLQHQSKIKKQQLQNHGSFFEKYKSGKAITKDLKQIVLNVYQFIRGNVQF